MPRRFIQWLNETSNTSQHLVRSYLFFRKSIGVIGVALPFVLISGRMVLELHLGISDSISTYYYTVMRNVFVGILFAIGIFLICYRYEHLDDIVSTLAGVFAICVAIFPTAPDGVATEQQMIIGWLHFLFAGGFFLITAFFAFVLFRKTDPSKNPTRRKQQRNKVYLFCSITIVACVLLIPLINLLILPGNLWLQPVHPVLWVESFALWAFGIAWFVKGETILKDESTEFSLQDSLRSSISNARSLF